MKQCAYCSELLRDFPGDQCSVIKCRFCGKYYTYDEYNKLTEVGGG